MKITIIIMSFILGIFLGYTLKKIYYMREDVRKITEQTQVILTKIDNIVTRVDNVTSNINDITTKINQPIKFLK